MKQPTTPAASGRLVLVPNALDHGGDGPAADLRQVLPLAVIERAATLIDWVVEDAKSARAFVRRVGEVTPLRVPVQAMSIHTLPRAPKGMASPPAHPGAADDPLDVLLRATTEGRDVGLLSDAGLVGVADPGAALVARAHRLGVVVDVLPGASALTLALAASGLNGQQFAFVGYVPSQEGERARVVRELEARSRQLRQTQMLIEAPYRNDALMDALLRVLSPTTRLSVSCGLTMPGGWSRTQTVDAWRTAPPRFAPHLPAVFAFLAS